MRLAQPYGGPHGFVHIGAADEPARQRGPGGHRSHCLADRWAASQRNRGFLENAHRLTAQSGQYAAMAGACLERP